jgi:hypothetical protein
MNVYLDDEPLQVEPPTLARAIEVARNAADARGRVVIEVKGDGRAVAADLLDNPPDTTAGLRELRLISTPPGPFVRETLLEARTVLDDAVQAQEAAADAIQSGSLEQALEPLHKALQCWSLVRDVVDQSQALLGQTASSITFNAPDGPTTGDASIARLSAVLADVRSALERSDWSALSDALAYDLGDLSLVWRAMLEALGDRADGRS